MIGSPRGWAISLVLALGLLFCLRAADPLVADPALGAVLTAQAARSADTADEALATVDAALLSASDHARSGSAATISGTTDPATDFLAAADSVAGSAPARTVAEGALERLTAIGARLGTDDTPALTWSAADLAALVAQLRSTAGEASAFVLMRQSAEAAMDALGDAAAAINASDLDAADAALARAALELTIVTAWEGRLDTLSVWLDTVNELAAASQAIVDAARAGDPVALAEARSRYATAAEAAALADRALAIALSEGGGAVVAPALASLADARRAVAAARFGLASLSILR